MSDDKSRAAFYSILSNSFLILIKLVAGVMSGSISIISEGAHSFMDLLASVIAFFSVKKSSQAPDNDHQFGHGKFEDLSGFLEGGLILIAACWIVVESIKKIVTGEMEAMNTFWGIVVMGISVVLNIAVSRYLFRVAAKTDSMALKADAEHLRTDVLTSAGVLIGLILIHFTDRHWLDPVVAIIVAILITYAGAKLCYDSLRNLLDNSLPAEDLAAVMHCLGMYIPDQVVSFSSVRSRKAGAERFVELVLIIPGKMTVEAAHALCDEIEQKIKAQIDNAHITIHMEPCPNSCKACERPAVCLSTGHS